MAESDLEAIFEKATEYAKSNMGGLQTDQILNLYGLYKQATCGENKTPKPNFWNMTAKQKWEAWSANGKKTQSTAMQEYIAIVTSLNPSWLSEPAKSSWVVHSTLQNNDTSVPESEQDIFYWVKENQENLVRNAVINTDLSIKDEDGLTLLHWAADRGHVSIIRLLIESGADPNVRDEDGQTPLHYAASCGHATAVAALIQGKASILIADNEGNKPSDIAATPEIVEIINSRIC